MEDEDKPVAVLCSRTEPLEMLHKDKDLRALLEVPASIIVISISINHCNQHQHQLQSLSSASIVVINISISIILRGKPEEEVEEVEPGLENQVVVVELGLELRSHL